MTHAFKTLLLLATASTVALSGCRDNAEVADADTVPPVTVTASTDSATSDGAPSPYANLSTQSPVSVADDLLRDEPFIYSVRDDDSEVILYPTFHILPKDVEWKSDTLNAAIARADEVWFELPVGAGQTPEEANLVMQLGMSETPLSERLTPEQLEQITADMGELGMPMAMIEPMEPWFAAVNVPVILMMQAGYDPTLGAESQLQTMIGDRPTRGLETFDQQMRFFSDMDEDVQIDFLLQSVADSKDGIGEMDRLAAAWASGDMAVMEDEFVGEMMRETPDLYRTLLIDRNTDWVEQLETEMKGEGVDFVAVGGAHLVGPHSVPALLAERGYDVEVITLK